MHPPSRSSTEDDAAGSTRLRVMIHGPDGRRTGGGELLDQPVPQDGWLWVDLCGVDASRERAILEDRFGISPLAVQDAQRDRHPPKLELFDESLFLLIRELAPGDALFAHFAIFLSRDFMVTRSATASHALDRVWSQLEAGKLKLNKGPGHVAYRLCRTVIDQYTPRVLELEERLGDLEDAMFERPSDEILEALAGHNRTLKKLRRTLAYQHSMMAQIASDNDPMPFEFDYHEFNDVSENMERLTSLCQLNQELAVDLMNAYLSVASHHLNQIMRVLTIATVLFLPLGLLAGIYGMNFEWIPELKWRYGYFAVIGTMLTVVVALVLVFRRKRWL